MGVNQVLYGDEVLVDLTGDTVTPTTLAEGVTAHGADGERIVGTMPTDVVRYGEQTLTDAQKTQARSNIGAVGSEHTHSDYAKKSDIATTATLALSNSAVSYAKISGFGDWGNGAWYAKGFSMLITSRAGETIWVSVSSDDSNTNAKAIRLLNTYTKLQAVYYSVSESAVYVRVSAWCNNVNAHILSNVNGDYVPTVTQASELPSDAVQIGLTEFGPTGSATNIGNTGLELNLVGKGDRPKFNSNELALNSDIPSKTDTWTFTYEDGTTETKEVYIK